MRLRPRAAIFLITAAILVGYAVAPAPADATTFSFTKTFGGATGFSASITVSWNDATPSQIKILAKNTTTLGMSAPSADLFDTGCPQNVTSGLDSACRLLTTFGWADNAISQSILSGSAVIPAGSVGVGDVSPYNYAAGTDWSAEWGYANNKNPNGIGTFDFLSGNVAQTTQFATSPNRDGPEGLAGPQAGILSSTFASAGGLGYVKDTLEFTVNFSSALNFAAFGSLQAAKWFVEFGSSGYWLTTNGNGVEEAAEPATLLMLGIGLMAVVVAGRVRRLLPDA